MSKEYKKAEKAYKELQRAKEKYKIAKQEYKRYARTKLKKLKNDD